MKVINLTPHSITLRHNGKETTFPPSGEVARLSEENTPTTMWGFPCTRKKLVCIENLPPHMEVEDRMYIVSSFAFSATDRKDVVAPDTGPDSAIRNEKGHIIAVKRFVCH